MDDLAVLPARHKLDVDTYHRMAEAGIFGEGDRIELIDVDLIDMAPIGQGHAAVVNGLNQALAIARAGRAIVSPCCAIAPTSTRRASRPVQRRPGEQLALAMAPEIIVRLDLVFG